jgi:enolase-phosphatase E1
VRFEADAALIDIEGTVGSIAFVRDVLFPFAKQRLDAYVRAHCEEAEMQAILAQAAREAGLESSDISAVLRALHDWSDRDVKVTPLKELQGRIWTEGFLSSGLHAHLYDDAVQALHRFARAGIDLYVYSSGSVAAQQLLFGHSDASDVLPLFRGFFDTTIGSKRERASYQRICAQTGSRASRTIFFSDSEAELDAASESGIQTVQLARPEDATPPSLRHLSVASFDGIELQR